MTRTMTAAAAALLAGTALTFADTFEITAGADDAAIRAALEAEGYEVIEIEREEDEIEGYATRGGLRYELEADLGDGPLSFEIEEEDDDEDDKGEDDGACDDDG